MTKISAIWHWQRCRGFAIKLLMCLNGREQRLYYGNLLQKPGLRWQEIVKAKDDETPLSVAERARRNLEADVELFIDVLCDTGLQPVFSEDDREQVIAVYGPVHARLLRQSLELISDAGEVKK